MNNLTAQDNFGCIIVIDSDPFPYCFSTKVIAKIPITFDHNFNPDTHTSIAKATNIVVIKPIMAITAIALMVIDFQKSH